MNSKFDFGKAVELIKKGGYKVAREGWNGKEMYIRYINPGNARCDGYPMQPCIGFKTAHYEMQPGWLPSQADMFAEDWMLVQDTNTNIDDVLVNISENCFYTILEAVKNGKRAARKGWNGQLQYIELASNITYVNPSKETVSVQHDAIGSKAIAFIGTSGIQIGWLATQADILAEDWVIVE